MITRLTDLVIRKLLEAKRGLRFLIYKTSEADVMKRFHMTYYHQGRERGLTWKKTCWLGTQVLKCPFDLWIYQEIIHRIKPDLIIETGTFKGGSALFMASICDICGTGQIVSIDIKPAYERPNHERITYLTGSSTSESIVTTVKELARDAKTVMVLLDSAHEKNHVLNELQVYAPLVTLNSYLIVEDTHLNGNPIRSDFGDGPMEAVTEFLQTNSSFRKDPIDRKFLLTFHPGGYLVRVKG